jgi:hypothetical protein
VSEQSYPVTVLVKRPDGSTENVRVGTAVRTGEGFRLSLGELSIGPTPDFIPPPQARRPPPPASAGDGPVFPNYGQSRGQPVAGATQRDLEFYASGCRRTLADPAKSRFHDKERVLLAAIEAELARQGAGGAPAGRSQGAPSYAPRGDSAPPGDDFGAPDYTDDDIPF